MNYVIEIENPKIKWAMEKLGISPSELEKKNLEDFCDPNTLKEISLIRFEFYNRNLEKALDLISELAYEKFFKKTKAEQISNFYTKEIRKIKKRPLLTAKDKNLIIHAVEASKINYQSLTPNARSPFRKNSKFSMFLQKQKENYKKLSEDQKTFNKKALAPLNISKATVKLSKTNIFHIKSHSAESCHTFNKKFDDNSLIIESQLLSIQEKLEKSTILHQKYMEKKREVAKTPNNKRVKIDSKDDLQIAAIRKIIRKQTEIEN